MQRMTLTLAVVAVAPTRPRQTAPATLRLTVDEAVRMALEHNVDLKADRLDPQISDTRVAAAAGAFRPTINYQRPANNQLQPPASFLVPTATRTDVVTSNAGLEPAAAVVRHVVQHRRGPTTHTEQQQLPEQLQPAAAVGAVGSTSRSRCCAISSIDPARQQLAISRTNRDIADTRLRESLVHTTADVKSGVLEPGGGPRQRRGAAIGARARRGAGAREQGQGRRRHSRRRSISCRRRPKWPPTRSS